MNNKNEEVEEFLLIVIISLCGAFIGSLIANYLGIKSIYGILIGFFIPPGIKAIYFEDSDFFSEMFNNIVMFIFLLIVPTFGLALIFVPLIGIGIIVIWSVINGMKEFVRVWLELLEYKNKHQTNAYTKKQNKEIKPIMNNESKNKDKMFVKSSENMEKTLSNLNSFKNCHNEEMVLDRLEILRENISKYSNGEFKTTTKSAINVNWKWTNYFEIRLDNVENDNIIIEFWIADIKKQWNHLSKLSSLEFVAKQKPTYQINDLNINAKHYVGAYIKLGDSYGKTLAVADYKFDYVKSNLNKKYYEHFYNTIGGRWIRDTDNLTFIRNGKLLIEEIEKLPLLNRDAIINYIKKETRNVINLSLGTTVKICIPIKELAQRDTNFNYYNNIDELAKPLYNLIIEYKNKIES